MNQQLATITDFSDPVAAEPSLLDQLTPREYEVAELVARGWSNDRIADAVFLAKGTVEHYTARIYMKAGLERGTGLSIRAALVRRLILDKRKHEHEFQEMCVTCGFRRTT